MSSDKTRRPRWLSVVAVAAAAVFVAGACSSGAAPKPSAGAAEGTITVAMVGNPQMKALEQLKGEFEKAYPKIKVNLLILPENEIRAKVTTDVATGAGTFDLVTIGMYEVPLWAKQGWIEEVGTTLDADKNYDSADFFKSIRDGLSYNGKLYAAPFYGESSALFYRKDLFEAAGITMPERPTWTEVAEMAKKLHNPSADQYGICLRGLPGWGEQGAPLGTVINTFGGRWFDKDWNAQLTSPETTKAIKFYIDLVKNYGEPGATSAGFTECETLLVQGKVAMWYDATSASDLVFDPKHNPKYADKLAITYAPTDVKKPSGWLWAWAFAMESTSKNKPAAYEFMKWATSKEYSKLVAEKLSWGQVPSGARQSLYQVEGYKEYGKAFNDVVLKSLGEVDPLKATNFADTPYTGIQFVQIPEFQDLGNKATQLFAGAIAGQMSADEAIKQAQALAEQVAKTGGYKK